MIFYFKRYFTSLITGESTKADSELLAFEGKTKGRDAYKDERAFKAASLSWTLKGETKGETTARLLINGTAGLAGQLAPIKPRGLFVSASIPSEPLVVRMHACVCVCTCMIVYLWIKSTSTTMNHYYRRTYCYRSSRLHLHLRLYLCHYFGCVILFFRHRKKISDRLNFSN